MFRCIRMKYLTLVTTRDYNHATFYVAQLSDGRVDICSSSWPHVYLVGFLCLGHMDSKENEQG